MRSGTNARGMRRACRTRNRSPVGSTTSTGTVTGRCARPNRPRAPCPGTARRAAPRPVSVGRGEVRRRGHLSSIWSINDHRGEQRGHVAQRARAPREGHVPRAPDLIDAGSSPAGGGCRSRSARIAPTWSERGAADRSQRGDPLGGGRGVHELPTWIAPQSWPTRWTCVEGHRVHHRPRVGSQSSSPVGACTVAARWSPRRLEVVAHDVESLGQPRRDPRPQALRVRYRGSSGRRRLGGPPAPDRSRLRPLHPAERPTSSWGWRGHALDHTRAPRIRRC